MEHRQSGPASRSARRRARTLADGARRRSECASRATRECSAHRRPAGAHALNAPRGRVPDHGAARRRSGDRRRGGAPRARRPKPGVDFHYCANARRRVARAREETRPTVILQDLVMPGVDGLTLVRQYRAESGDARHSDHRAVDQGRAAHQERGVRGGRERLSGEAAGHDRTDRAHPLSLALVSEPAAARRGVSRAAPVAAATARDQSGTAAADAIRTA